MAKSVVRYLYMRTEGKDGADYPNRTGECGVENRRVATSTKPAEIWSRLRESNTRRRITNAVLCH